MEEAIRGRLRQVQAQEQRGTCHRSGGRHGRDAEEALREMNLRDTDLEWLASNFPELAYVPKDRSILGELRLCAAFDRDSGQLKLGDTEEHRAIGAFLCDAFKVRLDLGHVEVKAWPKVYEVGGRRFDIAERNQCGLIDLHFYDDGACCLTLSFSEGRNPPLQRFILGLVIPFFYRLSYTDRYGIDRRQK